MVQAAHHRWQHPGDKPGRFQVFDLARPRVVGVLANTPWPIAGEHVPTRMLEAAGAVLDETFLDPAAACAALLRRLQASLKPFIGAAAWGNADDWEASWDFGGSAAFVVAVGGELALARVGELRVVSLTSDGIVSVLLREHTLELPEQHAVGVSVAGTANVITASLSNHELPPDAIWTGELVTASWVLLGTPEVLDLVDGGKASRHLKGSAFPEAAQRVFEDIHEARLRVDSDPSSALVIVELP